MNSEFPKTRDDVLPKSYQDCFGCGDANPAGIDLKDIRREGDLIKATLNPHPHHQGFPGVLHGGVVTAALDEVMAYACVIIGGKWSATAKLELRFRQAVPLQGPLLLEAGLVEPISTRRFHTWGKLFNGDTVCAEATALFMPAPEEMVAGLSE